VQHQQQQQHNITMTARRRIALSKIVDTMAQLAAEDLRSSQAYGRVSVEESMSGKTWKIMAAGGSVGGGGDKGPAHDHLVNTIWDTQDYRSFLETQARLKEELQNRPKPPPGGGGGGGLGVSTAGAGGGAVAAAAPTATSAAPPQAPVAALVQHLLARKDADKHRRRNKSSVASNQAASTSRKAPQTSSAAAGSEKSGGNKARPRKRKTGKKVAPKS
jgi:hypothetical protein